MEKNITQEMFDFIKINTPNLDDVIAVKLLDNDEEYDSLDEYCYMVPLLKKFTEVEHYFNKFKTLDDIVKFEEVEFKKVVKQNTQINHLKNESIKKRDKIYKKYS